MTLQAAESRARSAAPKRLMLCAKGMEPRRESGSSSRNLSTSQPESDKSSRTWIGESPEHSQASDHIAHACAVIVHSWIERDDQLIEVRPRVSIQGDLPVDAFDALPSLGDCVAAHFCRTDLENQVFREVTVRHRSAPLDKRLSLPVYASFRAKANWAVEYTRFGLFYCHKALPL